MFATVAKEENSEWCPVRQAGGPGNDDDYEEDEEHDWGVHVKALLSSFAWCKNYVLRCDRGGHCVRLFSTFSEGRLPLKSGIWNPIVETMKRMAMVMMVGGLCWLPVARAQDAATEEKLNKLSGQVADLTAGQESLRKHIDNLLKEIESVREQANKPTGNYASVEDLNRLRDALKEVDRKRLEDGEKVRSELLNLRKALLSQPAGTKKPPAVTPQDNPAADKPQKGFEYVVQPGDTLSAIVQGCREKNIKVTVEQILQANPGLKAERLRAGQKVFIPGPQS